MPSTNGERASEACMGTDILQVRVRGTLRSSCAACACADRGQVASRDEPESGRLGHFSGKGPPGSNSATPLRADATQ